MSTTVRVRTTDSPRSVRTLTSKGHTMPHPVGICRICGSTVDPNAPGGEWDVCQSIACFDAAVLELEASEGAQR